MSDRNDWLGRLLYWVLMAVVVVVAIKLALWLAGTLLGTAVFLLFTVVPLALLGWMIVKLYRYFRRDDDYRHA